MSDPASMQSAAGCEIQVADRTYVIDRLVGAERVGLASHFDIDLRLTPEDGAITPTAMLRHVARIRLRSDLGERIVHGVVTRFRAQAREVGEMQCYRLRVESRLALLALSRRSRTFQHLSIPSIIERVVRPTYSQFACRARMTHLEQRYVVQYQETDADFVRRLCEEHGLYFHIETADSGAEVLILSDTSSGAHPCYTEPLLLGQRLRVDQRRPMVCEPARELSSAVGSVALRDYDLQHPNLDLDARAVAGLECERDLEVYEGHGGYAEPAAGAARARLRLESLRAEASTLALSTNALGLTPGGRVDVALDLDSDPAFDVTGAYFIAGVTTRWLRERGVFGIEVRATLLEIPFRLKRSTPKPRIHGLQSATVTGAQGREIQPDGLGRVHLRFHWDCAGPRDHTSSPPFRVVQPHLPGALITPRVGWECFVMFDDGIPEQPYVLGRSYNGKQTPPLALPANKTVSSIATDSSPGGGARAVLQFDDAAGREHLLVNAPSSKLKQVSANNTMQVMKNEGYLVKGSLTASVGATESISVKLGWLGKYGTRAVSVGAAQHQNAAGNFVTSTGTTQVVVGAAVLEQVGDPVSGAANLLKDTALARIGATGALGAVVAAAAGIGLAAKDGAEQGGEAGALAAAERSALGVGMSFIPGGEAILSQVLGSSKPLPWDHGEPEKGDVAPGGGAAAASGGDGGPAAPGPGHRGTLVNGSYSEMVGAGYAIATPGSVSWVTLGAATVMVNGSHTTSALHAGMTAAGGMLDSAGSIKATSKADVVRKVLGWLNTSISGSLNVLAGREYQLTVKSALDLKVDGALDLNASTVTFKCGSAVISASSGGVKISAPSIKVTGASKQSGSLSHK